VIEKGLNPGDRVVVEGAQKVRPGMTVKPTVVEIKDRAAGPPPSPSAPKAAVAGA
jgi:hypothetical protein